MEVFSGTPTLVEWLPLWSGGFQCHSSQFSLGSPCSWAPARSQWRKVCRITVLTRPQIPTALAKCQAVQNRQVCRATGTALTRMSRTSIVITTGVGITVTGIGESAYLGRATTHVSDGTFWPLTTHYVPAATGWSHGPGPLSEPLARSSVSRRPVQIKKSGLYGTVTVISAD